MEKPILAITMGDPSGSGPEITARALAEHPVDDICRPLVIGDSGMMEKALEWCGLTGKAEIRPVRRVENARFRRGVINVYEMGLVNPETLEMGKISAAAGEAAFQYVKKAIELAMSKVAGGTVTNAISKEAINAAGHHYSGHTEIYAEYTSTKHYAMMLCHHDLRVIHVSTHVSLREACDRVKRERVLEVIRLADQACRGLGISAPRIAVAGLNPHCGEHGLFGTEDEQEILPAVLQARAEGLTVEGPLPADTIFSKALGGWYDIVVVMYHDQGHIPLKTVGFVYDREKQAWSAVEGINVTLGLPIIRVSVDHGTAYEHAGRGTANELSLLNAIAYAAQAARNRQS